MQTEAGINKSQTVTCTGEILDTLHKLCDDVNSQALALRERVSSVLIDEVPSTSNEGHKNEHPQALSELNKALMEITRMLAGTHGVLRKTLSRVQL